MNLAAIDLNLLVAFEALMAERGVTRAGQRVGLGQPAMSAALSRLRLIFKDELLVRVPGAPMRPTTKAIALHQPVARDLRLVALILKSLSDVERMGDYVVHVAEDGAELAQAPALKKYVNLARMLERLGEMSQNLRTSLADRDVTRAEATIGMDDEVDELYEQIQRELVTYMLEDPRNISKALMLMRVGRSLERVGDHMENVAERVRYWVTGARE